MENLETREQLPLQLAFSVSPETETERLVYTLKKYSWFKEQNYLVYFPKSLDPEKTYTPDEIRESVEREFDREFYEEKTTEIEKAWESHGKHFFEKASNYGIALRPLYEITLTRYGVGGSYGYPNRIQLNIENKSIESIMELLPHEMIHLSIEEWIVAYKTPHWIKERIVDLTYNKLFDKPVPLQTDPENPQKVKEVFDQLFPNLEAIIMKLSPQT